MSRQLPVVERWIRWLVVVLVGAGILWASVTRPAAVRDVLGPLGIVGLDKWLHGLAYAALAVALAYALAEWDATAAAPVVFGVAMAFGLGVEVLQAAIPYRDFSWWDLLANGIGAVAVTIAWRAVAPRLSLRRRPVLGES